MDDRVAVANAMTRYGGGFVEALGKALMVADPDNAQRIKEAFPEYWERFAKLAKTDKENHE